MPTSAERKTVDNEGLLEEGKALFLTSTLFFSMPEKNSPEDPANAP